MKTDDFLELEENKELSTKALLRKFAKIHVKLALKKASEDAKTKEVNNIAGSHLEVDKQSILFSYNTKDIR
jgi:hypothetical protein